MQELFQPLLNNIAEILVTLLSTLLAAVLMSLRNYLAAKAGKETSDRLMDTLHRAIQTGVEAAVAVKQDATPEQIVDIAIDHAKASIPDTLKALSPTRDVMINIALSKIGWAKNILPK